MSDESMDVKLKMKVMVNRERNKVLYAVVDNYFADILLSFLTLPLGRIVKVLEKQYGDGAPTIGSIANLYRSLADLDASRFVTGAAKNTLLSPRSPFDVKYHGLELDIHRCDHWTRRSWYGFLGYSDGFLTSPKSIFTISDDLQIFSNEMGLLQIITILGITDAHKAEEIEVGFGMNEVLELLKASMASQTPLSDVIFPKKTGPVKHREIMEPQPNIEVVEENPDANNLSLLLMIQVSSGKCLYAQAYEDFIDFLFAFLHIPIGRVEHILGGKTSIMAINNLYRTTADLKQEYFESLETKNSLMIPQLSHDCISCKHLLPLFEEKDWYADCEMMGGFLLGPQTYMVTDDLTITPFCAVSALSTLNNLKIPMSDLKEVKVQIGLKELLSIMNASLASTSALSDALLSHGPNKQVKWEV